MNLSEYKKFGWKWSPETAAVKEAQWYGREEMPAPLKPRKVERASISEEDAEEAKAIADAEEEEEEFEEEDSTQPNKYLEGYIDGDNEFPPSAKNMRREDRGKASKDRYSNKYYGYHENSVYIEPAAYEEHKAEREVSWGYKKQAIRDRQKLHEKQAIRDRQTLHEKQAIRDRQSLHEMQGPPSFFPCIPCKGIDLRYSEPRTDETTSGRGSLLKSKEKKEDDLKQLLEWIEGTIEGKKGEAKRKKKEINHEGSVRNL